MTTREAPTRRGQGVRGRAAREPVQREPGDRERSPVRLLLFEDSVYWQDGGRRFTDQAFLWFALHLSSRFSRTEVLGRLDPVAGRSHYELPSDVEFSALPYYPTLASPASFLAIARSMRVLWGALGRADVVWLLGPHPLALVLAVLAPLRRTHVVLGVRQDLPAYTRHRHPGRPLAHLAADLLEAAWRRLGQRRAVVVVGPDLARAYRTSRRLVQLGISVVPATDLELPATARSYDGELTVVSVGRLEAEKNPLLLADVLALLRAHEPRWRLVVCGEGPMRDELQSRLARLGLSEHAELRGYVPVDGGLREVYRDGHVLLHVSWTEGVPQVLYEAWAAGLPVVATDVGGVREVADGAARLLPPGDAAAAAAAVVQVAADDAVRAALVSAGRRRAADTTLESGLARLTELLDTEARCAG